MREGLALRVVITRLQVRHEVLVVADGNDGIEMRKAPREVLALFGDDAAGDRDRAIRGLPLL